MQSKATHSDLDHRQVIPTTHSPTPIYDSLTMPEVASGAKRHAASMESDAYSATNGASINDFVSQRLDSKRLRMTQYDEDEDEDDEDEDDEDEDDEDDVQAESESEESSTETHSVSNTRGRLVSAMAPAQAGIIEKISLQNFMCHDSFELELGPQLNFIIGRNGSGKSAILTGISVGLGAKATDTSRGSSIKSLIKDGKSTARVTIILKNEGSEAYQPDLLGKKIIVERKFQRQGNNNTYYIKNGETGKTIYNKKSILDDICYRFNITVDNPLAFLSQDKAREFLTATTDHIKYDYFMAGALINDILENYKSISQNIVEVKSKLKLVQTDLKVAQEKYEESKSLYSKFKKSDYLRRQLDEIHGKMLWFNVQLIQTRITKCEQEINKNEEVVILIDEELEEMQEKFFDTFESEKARLSDLATESHNKFEEKAISVEALKEITKETKIRIDDINNEISNGNDEIEQMKSDIKKLKKEIKLEQEKIDELNGGSKEKLTETLEQLKETSEELKTKRDEITAQLEEERSSGYETAEVREGKRKLDQSNEQLSTLRERMKYSLDLQKDKYTPWGGKEINYVLREIKKIGEDWHHEPIGPIGSFVEVKSGYSAWKDLLNVSFGKTLDSFLVHDDHDRRILEDIMRRSRINKNIITRKYEKFNYEQGKARVSQEGVAVIMDVLEIKDSNVLYTMIDSNSIEKNVLVNDRKIARQVLSNGNVLNVYSLLDHKSGHKSSGDSNTFKIDPVYYRLREPHKFSSGESSAEDLKELQEEISTETVKNNELVRALRRLKMSHQNELQDLTKSREDLDLQIKKVSNKIYEIENKLTESGDLATVDSLREKLDECEKQIKQQRRINDSLKEDKDEELKTFNKEKLNFQREKKTLDGLEAEMKEYQTKLSDLQSEYEAKVTERTRQGKEREEKERAIGSLKEKLSEGYSKLKEHTDVALAKCVREDISIEPTDTAQSITEEYMRAQEAVQESEKSIGRSYEEIQEELLSNKAKKEHLESTELNLGRISKSLEDDLDSRLKYLETTIIKSIGEASNSFERSLALRGFKGELKFGFAEKTLTMLVQTSNVDSNGQNNGKRTVESLSGGEKSFTQIALLLAIWKAMNSKIRGLDEFDVFMDSVNRTISIKLLLTELRKYPKSQSIFITPQAITKELEDMVGEDVKIHEMDDPRNK